MKLLKAVAIETGEKACTVTPGQQFWLFTKGAGGGHDARQVAVNPRQAARSCGEVCGSLPALSSERIRSEIKVSAACHRKVQNKIVLNPSSELSTQSVFDHSLFGS